MQLSSKTWLFPSLLIFCSIAINSCKKISKKEQPIAYNDYATFNWFEYKGNDSIFNHMDKTEDEYFNPIFAGFYPDPSICRANDKYYLVTSTFTYLPGLPIFESTDLVNWKQVGHAITRSNQADFSHQQVSRGMFAPTIRFNEGTFYIICTNVDSGGNFIVTTQDPFDEWSNPIWLPEINGIDPDLFFDDDGRVYITHNGPPPNNISMHEGHRAIYTWEYSLEEQKIISEQTLLVDGGTDMAKEPVWIEAPHILKRGGYYYLICAEGGTAYEHSEVVFKSKNVLGPYTSFEGNPILTQRHLDKTRPNQITTTGHADFVETQNGEWWAVYLGCRPYDIEYYNTGRETFMLPVAWENGWPTFEKGNEPHPFVHKRPDLPKANDPILPMSGNFVWKDDFTSNTLDYKWNYLRNFETNWLKLENNALHIKPQNKNIHEQTNFSFLSRRQQHLEFEASTKVNYELNNNNEAVGLVAFQNEKHYLFIGKRLDDSGEIEIFVERVSSLDNNGEPAIIGLEKLGNDSEDLFLKIEGKSRYYSFYFKTAQGDNWRLLTQDVDGINLSTQVAKGFVGTMLGMYASKNHFN